MHTNKGNSPTNLSLHALTCISNPTYPSHYTTPWLSTNTMWPRAGAPEESEIPNQADFHICAQGQSFFVWNLILKQGGLRGCLRIPPCLQGKGWGKGREAEAGTAAQCSGFGCQQEIWEWLLGMGKDACTPSNLTIEKENSHTGTCRRWISFPPKFVFSQGESSLYNSQIAVWGLQALTQQDLWQSKWWKGTHNFNPREMCGLRQGSQALYLSIFSI